VKCRVLTKLGTCQQTVTKLIGVSLMGAEIGHGLETEETLFDLRQKQGNFSPPKCPLRFVAQSASNSLRTEGCLTGGSGELEWFVWRSYQIPFTEKI
jgi:hypothetical protein